MPVSSHFCFQDLCNGVAATWQSCSVSDQEWTHIWPDFRHVRYLWCKGITFAIRGCLGFHHTRKCFVTGLWLRNKSLSFHLKIPYLRSKAKKFTSGLLLQAFHGVRGRAKTMKLSSVISSTELKLSSPEPTHVILPSMRSVPYNHLWHDMTMKGKKKKEMGEFVKDRKYRFINVFY